MEKPTKYDHEVFLSFRGPDTRYDIADYLYTSLIDAGIQAYRDNKELAPGEEIGPKLLQAIKKSKISIPILSKEYAASPWCLMELVQMVKCMEKWGQKIMPIFYDIAPYEVRHQTARCGEAINSLINKGRYTDENILNWKAALSEVGALKGWELKDRGKGEFTKEVVRELLIELKKNYLAVSNYLVEMDDHVDKIMEAIGEQTTETKIVGIHGMGGVGKTTLATIVYNKVSADSTNCCFLSNIRDREIVSLQNQLIFDVQRNKWPSIHSHAEGIAMIQARLSSRKVILVLDDVDQKTQLDALLGKGKCWFDRGSKVIITTRNKELLKDVDLLHELTGMDFDHSIQLFSKHAFGSDRPPAEYDALSRKAVKICSHLPLALEIIGSLLAKEDKKFWEATLEKLETIPDEDVKTKLNISFQAMPLQAKEIFLDICCFFVGFDVRIVSPMWKSYGFSPDYYLKLLQQKSLIKIIKRDQFWMHDLLRDLGRDFIRQNGSLKPEKQSRVWDHGDAIDVLIGRKGTENVEAIRLKFDHQSKHFFKKKEFASLSNLRFLQVNCGDLDPINVQHFVSTNSFWRNLPIHTNLRWLSWHNFIQRFPSTNWFQRILLILPEFTWLSWQNIIDHFPSINFFQRNQLILPNLRYLSWHEFPLFFPLTAFSLMKLVVLDLSRSEITDDWDGWNHLKMAKNLKVLNLTECGNLRRTPDFSSHQNLEQLILERCQRLFQVDKSIGKLKHLVFLNLKGCRNLRTLPNEMEELETLTELLVDWTSITNIPQWKGMKKLETLSAANCESLSICNLASCLTSLSNLQLGATKITELPFENFGSLVQLNLSYSKIEELPNSIKKMKNLRVLRMQKTCLRKLPSALGMLEKLEEIDASGCRILKKIPSEIGRLSFLRILRLSDTRISEVPKLPESLTNLYFTTMSVASLPDLSNLINLRVLELALMSGTPVGIAPSLQWIGRLTKLESLMLYCPRLAILFPPSDANLLPKLRKLDLHMENLECLPRLPQNLSYFRFNGRRLMEKSINLSYLEKLSELEVCNCEQLTEIAGLERLENLKRLRLDNLPSLVKLPDLTNLKKFTRLYISDCPELVEVRGQLESLEMLHIISCKSLEKLPDQSSFKNIEILSIDGCWKLKEIQCLEDLEHLSLLYLVDLPLLEKLPDLTNSKKLKTLRLRRCPRLVEIRGRLESLERLEIDRCRSLRKLSDPSSFKKLQRLAINKCKKFAQALESDEYSDLKKMTRLTSIDCHV